MRVCVGVVAHESRRDHAQALADKVDAVHIGFDDGRIGAGANHRRVWEALLRHPAEWCISLEDDAIPVDDFTDQAIMALTNTPTPIASFYLGRQRPPQHQHAIKTAVEKAQANQACWIVCDRLFHHVAVAIRRDLLPTMLTSIKAYLPIDEAVGNFARHAHHQIAYSVPSLVDHNDLLSSIAQHRDGSPRRKGRTAWQTGSRPTWHPQAVTM